MRISSFVAAVALVAAAAGVTACDRDRGADVKKQASNSLTQANIKDVNLDWDAKDRVMHMKGTVDSTDQKARAEQIVAGAVGSSGKVANELTVKGADTRTADNLDGSIKDHLKNLIDNEPGLKNSDVDVEVKNGVVTLTGKAVSEDQKAVVGKLANAIPGVNQVVNSVQVKSTGAASARKPRRDRAARHNAQRRKSAH